MFCLTVLLFVLLFYSNKDIRATTIYQEVGFASSPNPVGSGARATGMGGAFIGIADDATSASWNPAGLIQLERPEISVVGAYLNRRDFFSSETYPEMNNTGRVDDVNINYFSATYPFQFYRNMVVSINYQRLYEFKRNFDYQYEFSYPGGNILQIVHFKQKGYIGALGFAYAIEVLPTFSLGTSLNIWTDKLIWENGWEETLNLRDVSHEGSATETVDTIYSDKYSEFCGINTNLGILWNMNKYITLGIVIKTPFDASIHHEFNYIQTKTIGPPLNPPPFDEDVKLRMPASYGGGLAWRVSDALSFDLDVYRTEWSGFVLIDSQGNRFSPVDGRPESSSKLKDTTQIRFGGEYLFISKKNHIVVPLRAGIFYDPETFYNDVRRFYGAAIGSGVAYKGIIFDVAYQLRWGRNVETGNLIATSRADIMQHLLLTSLIVHF
jgi:long-subunit fatty acid transport protein